MNTLEIIQEVFGNNEVSEKWLEKQFVFASKIWEMGIQEGMRREHAMWQLAKVGQEIELGITYEEANPPQPYCKRCGKKLGTEVTDIHTCTPIRREWVGLTEQEKKGIFNACEPDERSYVIAMTEALLKDKNHG